MITFTIFRGPSLRYYWHAKSTNGWVMADGAEDYATKANAKRAIKRFCKLLGATTFEIVEL